MTEKEVLQRLFTLLEEYAADRYEGKFVDYRSPAELKKLLQLENSVQNGNWDAVFTWIEQYLVYGVKTSHPAFVNRMWAGANLPSILGEVVVALTNTSACTYESAPVSTLMENYMIGQMLDLAGFTCGEGQMTTGSSNANLIAMMCARNLAVKEVKGKGLFNSPPLYAFVNSEAHYSMDKAANVLGIGSEQLIKVPVNEYGQMAVSELEHRLRKVAESGGRPFFVASTAGTTVRGAYDPIEELFALREEFGFWLHVDGAWGGAAIMSDRLRTRWLKGLEKADSFTCDFHKMLGSALMCNFLLVNRGTPAFSSVLTGGDGSYLFRDTEDEEVTDLGTVSLQCGRRVDSLKWFLDWKYFGKKGLGERIEKYLTLCEYAEQCVEELPEFEMTAPRTSFNICFRFKVDGQDSNSFNEELRGRLYRRGVSLVGIAYIGDMLTLRLLITNTSVDRKELDLFFAELVKTGREMVDEGWAGSCTKELKSAKI